MRRYAIMLLAAALPALALAQAGDTNVILRVPTAGYFFVALLAGLILALAFQLILTNLSVAAGLNVLGNVTDPRQRAKNRDKDRDKVRDASDRDEDSGGTAVTISNAFGVWAMVTASVALFFGSWLATELSLTNNITVGAVLGLVIWGMFYLVMMTIEVNAVTSLAGSLVRMAQSGLRTAYSSVTGIFHKSSEDKTKETAVQIVDAVREEVFGASDADEMKAQIRKYIEQLKPEPLDPGRIRQEFSKLLEDTEIRAVIQQDPSTLTRETILAELHTKGVSAEHARSVADGLMEAVSKIREEAQTPKDTPSKVVDTAMRLAGVPAGQAEARRRNIEAYLAETGREELNPEGIKRDLERMFRHPAEGMAALRERLAHMNRDTLTALVTQRGDMNPDEVNRVVDQVERTLSEIRSRVESASDAVTGKLRGFFDSMNSSTLDYDSVAADFKRLLHDPKGGADALLRRLKSFDRDTLKSMIANRRDIPEEEAERIVQRLEHTRDELLTKAEHMKTEVQNRLDAVKREALHQADQARKVAATAAWWAFSTAVISGAAAVIGGIVAATTT